MAETKEYHEITRQEFREMKDIKSHIQKNSELVNQLVDEVVRQYAEDLDTYVYRVKELITKQVDTLTDEDVEKMILKIPLFMYSAASGLESLGVDSDIAKAVKLEVLNNAFMSIEGTIQDKTKYAELVSQKEQLLEIVYHRAYKKLKMKIEMAESIYSGVKKVLTKRIAELELSKVDRL